MRKIIPIEIFYKPVKNYNEVINCYFSNKTNVAFRSAFSENRIFKHGELFNVPFAQIITEETITYPPELEIDKFIIDCSFGHSEYTLNLNYLTTDQLNFKSNKTSRKLRDLEIRILAIAETFTTELKFDGGSNGLIKNKNPKI